MAVWASTEPRRSSVLVASVARPGAGDDQQWRCHATSPDRVRPGRRVHTLRTLAHVHEHRCRRGDSLATEASCLHSRVAGQRFLTLRRPGGPVQSVRRCRQMGPHGRDQGPGCGPTLHFRLRFRMGTRRPTRRVHHPSAWSRRVAGRAGRIDVTQASAGSRVRANGVRPVRRSRAPRGSRSRLIAKRRKPANTDSGLQAGS